MVIVGCGLCNLHMCFEENKKVQGKMSQMLSTFNSFKDGLIPFNYM